MIRYVSITASGYGPELEESSMSNRMEHFRKIWNRIESVLLEHAPLAVETLASPATDDELSTLEGVLGFALPDDLVASLRIHNGQNDPTRLHSFSGEGIFLSTTEIASTWNMLNGLKDGMDDWWSSSWIPFAQSDGSAVCINTERSADGRLGEVIAFVHDSTYEPGIAPSYALWLEKLAFRLEAGDFKVDEYGYLWLNLPN